MFRAKFIFERKMLLPKPDISDFRWQKYKNFENHWTPLNHARRRYLMQRLFLIVSYNILFTSKCIELAIRLLYHKIKY